MSQDDATPTPDPLPSVDDIRVLGKRVIDTLPPDGPVMVVVVSYVTGFLQYMLVEMRKTVSLKTFMKVAKLGFSLGRREAEEGAAQRAALNAKTIVDDAFKKAKNSDD